MNKTFLTLTLVFSFSAAFGQTNVTPSYPKILGVHRDQPTTVRDIDELPIPFPDDRLKSTRLGVIFNGVLYKKNVNYQNIFDKYISEFRLIADHVKMNALRHTHFDDTPLTLSPELKVDRLSFDDQCNKWLSYLKGGDGQGSKSCEQVNRDLTGQAHPNKHTLKQTYDVLECSLCRLRGHVKVDMITAFSKNYTGALYAIKFKEEEPTFKSFLDEFEKQGKFMIHEVLESLHTNVATDKTHRLKTQLSKALYGLKNSYDSNALTKEDVLNALKNNKEIKAIKDAGLSPEVIETEIQTIFKDWDVHDIRYHVQ